MTPLLVLLSVAVAQEPLPAPAEFHVLHDGKELHEGVAVYLAGALVNVRTAPSEDAPIARRFLAATRAVVLEDLGSWVEVRVGGTTGWVARELLSTMGRVADLDGDGVPERIVVAQDLDGATRAWLREGDRVQQALLHPWPDPYLGSWEIVPAAQAGVALLRVDLNQDRCGAYPSVWLSYADDQLRPALGVTSWADGAQGESFDVTFVKPGLVTVRQEVYGELEPVISERACVLKQGVFHCS